MTMYDIITKKKHNEELSTDEIEWFISGYVNGQIPDYQASAWLMSVCFNSLSDRETVDLTMAMARSGDTFTLGLDKPCIDKHSTGGVGDKTTLIVAPIVASCGIYVPKMSGRGLGHTGGTIDKLESIPGFVTSLDYETFIGNIKKAGLAVAGQTGTLVPADKKLYALRNATATVDSIPLICSSIMSKKLATGADGIVLDVKVGDGAFMKNTEDAEKLADAMVRTAKLAGRKCSAILTDMSKPLGRNIGNSFEVIEAIEVLKGNGPEDLHEICIALATEMLYLGGKGTPEECTKLAEDAISSGKALNKLAEMIILQGGNSDVINDYSLFKQADKTIEVYAHESGKIERIFCEKVGLISLALGAGRKTKDSDIDFSAGIRLNKTVGEYINKGDVLAYLYTSTECNLDEIKQSFVSAVHISDDSLKIQSKLNKNVIKIIRTS